MSALCNGTSLWDSNLTWYNTWPEFTDCFQATVLTWVPCGWLWLTSPYYIYYLYNVTPTILIPSRKYLARLILCSCLVMVSIINLVSVVRDETTINFLALRIAPGVQLVSLIFCFLIILLERKKGLVTSGVLFIFWLLQVVAGIVPFYTKIIQQVYRTDVIGFCMFFIFYFLVLMELLFACVADKPLYIQTTGVEKEPCPEVYASFLSRITYSWVKGILSRGYSKTLTEADVYDPHPRDLSANNMSTFLLHWNKQLARKKREKTENVPGQDGFPKAGTDSPKSDETTPLLVNLVQPNRSSERDNCKLSLVAALWRTFWLDMIHYQLWKLISELLKFIGPLLLSQLITFTTDTSVPLWKGFALSSMLYVASQTSTFFAHANWHYGRVNGFRVAAVVISTIFRKALTMSNKARKESTIGEITNLMSVDVHHLKVIIAWLWNTWASPLKIVLCLYLLYVVIGISMLSGLGVLLVLVPVNILTMNKWRRYQSELMENKDTRMKIINETLSGIKIIKLYAWEPSFREKITDVRKKELSILWKISMVQCLITFTWTLAPALVSLATFITYIYISEDHYLDPQVAFTTGSLLGILRLTVVSFPTLFADLVQGIVSMRRITKYLNTDDLDNENVQWNSRQACAIEVTNASFKWESDQEEVLTNINLMVKDGQFLAVVGQVGAGKSSLLSAILGDMEKVEGKASLKSYVANVPQQAWIQNDTLQNNILFGKPMDKERYDKILECCALIPDLEILPAGDMTEIGERGINLSGGQKQRVSLARAVYNDAGVYLLDDPLSAVDSHVGKHIFDELISNKGLLRNKTRILVSHGIQWLPKVDSIIVMTNGQISETGSYEELLQHDGPFAQFLRTYLSEHRQEDHDIEVLKVKKHALERLESVTSGDDTEDDITQRLFSEEAIGQLSQTKESKKDQVMSSQKGTSKQATSKLTDEETVEEGKVSLSVFLAYGRAVGLPFVFLAFLMYILFQAGSVGANTWLSRWTDDGQLNNFTVLPSNSSERINRNNYYLAIYGVLCLAQALCILTFSILWNFRTVRASARLHSDMLVRILRAPMSFFDTTPSGRIVNRFSQDMDIIDTQMPNLVEFSINTIFSVLSTIIVISYTTPIFLAVILPLVVLFVFVQRYYVTTSRQLRRLESKTLSPIYSHFGETLSGASVIRSFRAQDRFITESEKKVDICQRFSFYYFAAMRWQGVRLETIGNLIILAASLFAVAYRDTLTGGLVGLSISYALEATNNLNWMVQLVSSLETEIVSVERVKQYTEVPSEPEWSAPDRKPKRDWPQSGNVAFQDYSTQYRTELDLVLKEITFNIKPEEKVGVIGRTGAGKSSLAMSLFRLIEATDGRIVIDDVDVSTIGLHDLRKRLTILPQDPVIFAGSLRSNVDPFSEYTDPEIWTCLEHAHLRTFVESLPGTLEHECSEGGQNMSVGQRQLLCLARALLRKSKILILDEATAAVDMETDDLIQQTIRSEFKDCTILTIAHRLNTVMDYDRIMVLDNGQVVEFDKPSALLQQPNSIFYSMAKTAGIVA